jgi:hypothetical protein
METSGARDRSKSVRKKSGWRQLRQVGPWWIKICEKKNWMETSEARDDRKKIGWRQEGPVIDRKKLDGDKWGPGSTGPDPGHWQTDKQTNPQHLIDGQH